MPSLSNPLIIQSDNSIPLETNNKLYEEVRRTGKLRKASLDVWEGEPVIDTELFRLVRTGTPHIAGYSYDGKINGTIMLYEELMKSLGRTPDPDMLRKWLPLLGKEVKADNNGKPHEQTILEIINAAYDIGNDDRNPRFSRSVFISRPRTRGWPASFPGPDRIWTT